MTTETASAIGLILLTLVACYIALYDVHRKKK